MKKIPADFYIEIEDSVDLRREILETSKGLIGILQQYEDIKRIDTEKVGEIELFRSLLKEIGSDITRLKTLMPKVKLSQLPRKDTPVKEPRVARIKAPEPQPEVEEPSEDHAEISPNKLDSELKDIEKRLQDLQ
jgi:hypothetical protein